MAKKARIKHLMVEIWGLGFIDVGLRLVFGYSAAREDLGLDFLALQESHEFGRWNLDGTTPRCDLGFDLALWQIRMSSTQ